MASRGSDNRSDSAEQREAEAAILEAAEEELGIKFNGELPSSFNLKMDGFCDGDESILVEAWARQGKAKPGQEHKVMSDMCKLLLVEKSLAKSCRKLFVVCDPNAIAFLRNGGWRAKFTREFIIEIMSVCVDDSIRQTVRYA